MRPPSLSVEDNGRWVTAIDRWESPVGRPQTVVADLAGIWKGPTRRVRIATNMRIYRDRIRVADVVDSPFASITLAASRARERPIARYTTRVVRAPLVRLEASPF